MKIKVCGMRDGDNIRAVEALGIDIMGFVFYSRSPRYAASLPSYLPTACRRAGVFVDAGREYVLAAAGSWGLDTVQLHGDETPEECDALRADGLSVIKAVRVCSIDDVTAAARYDGRCDMLLFDTATKHYGGSGRRFDHRLLDGYRGRTPFLLSGGIGAGDAAYLSSLRHPLLAGCDLNSRFETSAGVKDPERIRLFIEELNEYLKI